jgi:hypothetical protein
METVLLFGAGASFGAGGIVPHAPPVGGQLYPALIRAYPKLWEALPADASRVFAVQGFEAGMAYIWQRYSQSVNILQKSVAHYFAQFQVSNQPCAYRSLISGLGLRSTTQRVMLATLNYDLTLDICLQMEQVRFGLGQSSERVVLNKPHGACNIFNDSIQASSGVSFTAGVSFGGGDIKAVPQIEASQRAANPNNVIPPILAIFMEGKPCQTSPELLVEWQRSFGAAVLAAKRVAVIGVHPHVADTHIWTPLAATKGELFFCGDEAAFASWTNSHRKCGPSKAVGSRFAESVDALVSALKP